MTSTFNYPQYGYRRWKAPTTFAALPTSGNVVGDARVATDLNQVYVWSGSAWVAVSGTPAGSSNSVQYNNGGTLTGVTLNATATKEYLSQTSSGTPTFAQVAQADVSGLTTGSSPTFTGANLSGLTASLPVKTDASKNLATGAINLASATEVTGALAAANFPALTGDITTSAGALATTLATVNTNTGSWGSSTAIPVFSVNGKGLITAASTAAVVAPASTLTGTTLASGVVSSSLTSVGTLATGTWSATTIAATKGGTGLTSATTGDLLAASGANTWSNLAAAATGKYLASAGTSTLPTWSTLNQAAVAGLTTADSPTFAGLVITGSAGLVKSTAGTIGSVSAGTSSLYVRGDLTMQTLNQAAVAGLTTASTPTFAGATLSGVTTIGATNNTTNHTMNGPLTLTLGSGSSSTWLQFMNTATSTLNWVVGQNYNTSGQFEITPSTSAGGSTFSTPALKIDSSSNVTFPTAIKLATTGGTASALNYYEEWSGSVVFKDTAGTPNTVTVTARITRIGRQVFLSVPDTTTASGTASNTDPFFTFSDTGSNIPTRFAPTTTQNLSGQIGTWNGTTFAAGTAQVTSSVITVFYNTFNGTATNWGSVTGKRLCAGALTWQVF